MSLEELAGIAAVQERIKKAMTGGDAVGSILQMQKQIEKATASHWKSSQLASVSEAILGNNRKLKSLGVQGLFPSAEAYKLNSNWVSNIHSITANAVRIQANWTKLIGTTPLSNLAKQNRAAIGMLTAQKAALFNSDFVRAMQAIAATAEKTQQYWQKVVDVSPMVRMAREFKQPDYLKAFLNPPILHSLEPNIAKVLSTQTEQAAVLAENYSAKEQVSVQDLNEFKEFVKDSFSALTASFKASQRSPMALIAFWSGIIALLWGILFPLLQPEAATSDQVKTLLQESRELKSEVRELHGDVMEMRKIIDDCLLDAIRDISKLRFTRCNVSLRLKPKNHSLFIYKVRTHQEVRVITISHKWAYVIVFDEENLPVTGWMLKKYFR